MTNLFGILLSFYLEFVGPLTSIKPAIEAIIGRDFVTKEKLNDFEKIMSIFAAVPILGTITKIVKYSAKFSKFYKSPEKIKEIINNILNAKDEIDLGKHLNESLRGIQDSISEIIDFVRYDDNLIAIIIRITLGIIYLILLIFMPLIIKVGFYIYSFFIKESKENQGNNNKSNKEDMNFDKFDEVMKKISSRGYNIRLIENILFIYLQLFFYYYLDKFDDESKEKVRGLETEMVKQYKKDKKNRQKENNLMEFIYDEKKWIKYNNEVYKFNIEKEKEKLKILIHNLKESHEKNKTSGFLKCLKGLFGNFCYLMKNNFGSPDKAKD